MQAVEIRDTGRLLAATLDEFTVAARDIHHTVAGRVFGLLGPRARAIATVHQTVTSGVYASMRAGVRYLPVIAARGAARRASGSSVHDSSGTQVALSMINGAVGDLVASDAGSLSTPMRLRPDGDLRTGRIALFVHGLCERDASWRRGTNSNGPDASFGAQLRAAAGWTPVYASYNSGLRISANGAELAWKLDKLVEDWPVPVSEIAIIGHSMGGLVARSAAYQGHLADRHWLAALRTMILLGVPNIGAPLERRVNAGTLVLGRLPEARPLATLLNRRSVGIKDLRWGSVVEDDWRDVELDDRHDRRTRLDLVPNVDHYIVGATLTRSAHSPLAPFLGDLLVPWRSATGQHPHRGIPFRADGWRHIGRASHFDLLDRPEVGQQLVRWLR